MAIAFLILPPALAILAGLAITAIVLVPKDRRNGYVVSGAACVAMGLAGAVIAFWMWGVGFEYSDAYKDVPPAIDDSMIFGAVTASLALAGLLATGAMATLRRRNSR